MMTKINRFEELECWKEARNFVKLIYELTKKDRFRKDFELVGQIKRSAISSMANIAETLSHSYIALDQTYISQSEIEKVSQQAEIVWKKVNNFISYLRRYATKGSATNKTN